MTCPACNQDFVGAGCACGWRPQVKPKPMDQPAAGDVLPQIASMYGTDLWHCVGAFGRRAWCRESYRYQATNLKLTVAERKAELARLKAMEAEAERTIAALLPKLPPEDVRECMRRYEGKA